MATAIILGVCGGYLAICLGLGFAAGSGTDSAAGYVAGDRTLGLVLMYFITGATVFSAFAFLGAPGFAYSRGAAVFYILGYGALGFVPFYFTGPRAAALGREHGFVTQGEMVASRLREPAMAPLMAIVSVAAFVPYLALQMKGAGYVLEAVTEGAIPTWLGAALVYAVVLAYVWKSGVLGVGWTNTFQGLFMMGLAWGLGLYLPYKLFGGVGAMFQRIAAERPELLMAPGLASSGEAWAWSEYSTAVLVSIVGFSAWPHVFMKAFAAKDERTIRRTVVLYPTFQIFLVPLFFIGFAGVSFEPPPAQADQILPHLLMNLQISPWVVGLFCAGALAASMSSGDAMAHAAASIVVRDGISYKGDQRQAIRWTVLAVMAASYALAISYQGSLVLLLLGAYGAVVQFAPPLVAALYAPNASGRAAFWGLLIGGSVTLLFTLRPELRPLAVHAGTYGLALNVAVLVAGSIWPTRKVAHLTPATTSPATPDRGSDPRA
jgi:solute:Na+ symporter, SSS family